MDMWEGGWNWEWLDERKDGCIDRCIVSTQRSYVGNQNKSCITGMMEITQAIMNFKMQEVS